MSEAASATSDLAAVGEAAEAGEGAARAAGEDHLALLLSSQQSCLRRLSLSQQRLTHIHSLAGSSGRLSRTRAALEQHSETIQRTRQQLVDITSSLQSAPHPSLTHPLHRCHCHCYRRQFDLTLAAAFVSAAAVLCCAVLCVPLSRTALKLQQHEAAQYTQPSGGRPG